MNSKTGKTINVNDSVIGISDKLKREVAGTVVELRPTDPKVAGSTDKIVVFIPVVNPGSAPSNPTVTIVDEIASPESFVHAKDGLDAISSAKTA